MCDLIFIPFVLVLGQIAFRYPLPCDSPALTFYQVPPAADCISQAPGELAHG